MDATPTLSLLEPRTPAEALAVEDRLRKIDASEVLDECADAAEALDAAMRADDALLVGQIVMGVRKAYALRLALRGIYEGVEGPTTEQAAAEVVVRHAQANQLIRAHAKAGARRFTGEAPTGFGSLA